MILVDTSVWIDHLRVGEAALASLLNNSQVLAHPFVTGELACGNLANRASFLMLLGDLPQASVATLDEVFFFIEQNGLMGKGIGYIDAHLLAATALEAPARFWTRDKRLARVAMGLNLEFEFIQVSD